MTQKSIMPLRRLPAGATRAPRVGFVSLGCPKALVDSERILTRLRAEGFEVTMFTPGMKVVPQDWDLMLYLFGEETLLTRGRIHLDWLRLTGHFGSAMARHWHDIPTVMISFGWPRYHAEN